jgi:hypothetical protein
MILSPSIRRRDGDAPQIAHVQTGRALQRHVTGSCQDPIGATAIPRTRVYIDPEPELARRAELARLGLKDVADILDGLRSKERPAPPG